MGRRPWPSGGHSSGLGPPGLPGPRWAGRGGLCMRGGGDCHSGKEPAPSPSVLVPRWAAPSGQSRTQGPIHLRPHLPLWPPETPSQPGLPERLEPQKAQVRWRRGWPLTAEQELCCWSSASCSASVQRQTHGRQGWAIVSSGVAGGYQGLSGDSALGAVRGVVGPARKAGLEDAG